MEHRTHHSLGHRARRHLAGLAVALAVLVGLAGEGPAQSGGTGHGHDPTVSEPKAAEPGRRVTSEELHRLGGVPRGWRFSLPAGDPARGRSVFADLECHKCHELKGETLPAVSRGDTDVGPELTGMGVRHPAEYLAESILTPNAVIVTSPGYTGPDGRSIMPSFADSLSVGQLVDLVAFLKSQTAGGPEHHDAGVEREQVVGDYRVRLVYASGHDHSGPGHAGAPGPGGAGQLMAFIADRETDEAVPYLGVTAIIHATTRPPRSLGLAPSLGERGFHYSASVTLPARTEKITLAIGPTTMQVLPAAGSRYKSPVSVTFEWGDR